MKLGEETVLWRAQIGGTPHQPPSINLGAEELATRLILTPHGGGRMTPYFDKAKEGRINPKGIPCLYTATHPRVALTEMKPAIGSYLTLAEFVTVKELRIVDFASPRIEITDSNEGPTDHEMASMLWEDINDAFAEPVTSADEVADYAPTQILSELFKCAGYDGIRYKSKCCEFESLEASASPERLDEIRASQPPAGLNVALFEIAAAEFRTSRLYRFAISPQGQFDFREVRTRVFWSDQIPDLTP